VLLNYSFLKHRIYYLSSGVMLRLCPGRLRLPLLSQGTVEKASVIGSLFGFVSSSAFVISLRSGLPP
jgi:hypothetical protein